VDGLLGFTDADVVQGYGRVRKGNFSSRPPSSSKPIVEVSFSDVTGGVVSFNMLSPVKSGKL